MAGRGHRPDPDGGEYYENTPYVYALAWQRSDGFYTGFSESVARAELATVKPTIAAHGDGTTAEWSIMARSATMSQGVGLGYAYAKLPATPGTYVTTEQVQWSGHVAIRNEALGEFAFLGTTPGTYRPRRIYRETWAHAVLGPAFPRSPGDAPWVSRTGDALNLRPWESDRDGHHGQRLTGRGSITLYRDGTELTTVPNESATVDVPAGRGDFRLDLQTTGTGLTGLSTTVQASWTFTSDTTPEGNQTPLPLWAIRFQPAVDENNVLRTGPTHVLPIVAEAQHGASVGRLTDLSVQTSTDDGRTWQTAPVRATGHGTYAVIVTVPKDASYVSVRTQATDSDGNTVQETIAKAYKVAR